MKIANCNKNHERPGKGFATYLPFTYCNRVSTILVFRWMAVTAFSSPFPKTLRVRGIDCASRIGKEPPFQQSAPVAKKTNPNNFESTNRIQAGCQLLKEATDMVMASKWIESEDVSMKMNTDSVHVVMGCEDNQNTRRKVLTLTASIFGGSLLAPQKALAAPQIDVNNAMAREFTAFPGLYPTIATKIVMAAKEKPFKSKKDVYNALDSDAMKDRLRQYDSSIVIKPKDAALRQFKESQICKYECGSRVSNPYRDEQIKSVQRDRMYN